MNEKSYDVMISIYVPVYNHEKYIAKALDGILMQKTEYSFEVLVGDDASTDNSRKILEEYDAKYPGFFQMFYREENMWGKEVNNAKDLLLRCCGKYIIPLEGDDFWTDENKLQKQCDFLEKNPDYLAVAHNCIVVDADSNPSGEQYPECKDEEYTMWHYANDILPGQLTTMMCRNYVKEDLLDCSFINLGIQPGDRRKAFSLITNGKIYCMQAVMSAYRHITTGGSSFSANLKYDYEKEREWYVAQMDYAYKLNNKNAIRCAEVQYLLKLRSALLNKRISFKRFREDMRKVNKICICIMYMIKRDVLKHIFKKKVIKL